MPKSVRPSNMPIYIDNVINASYASPKINYFYHTSFCRIAHLALYRIYLPKGFIHKQMCCNSVVTIVIVTIVDCI